MWLNDAVAITQLCVVKRRRFLDDYERSRGAEKTIAEIGIATDDRRPTTGDRLGCCIYSEFSVVILVVLDPILCLCIDL